MKKKIYENSIVNWPEEERPREKLLKRGVQQLTNAELLAILLRVGVRGKSAVDLARSLIQELGGLRALALWDTEELCQLHGLSLAKVAQIKAAIELGNRVLAEEKKTLGKVYSSHQVYEYLLPFMRDLKQEIFKVLYLNSRNQIIHESVVGTGTLNTNAIYPREIMSQAYRVGAAAVVFAHNHPSGSTIPSSEDRRITRELVAAGEAIQIHVIDHLIIGENRYSSFADNGYIDQCKDEYIRFIGKRF